MIVVMACVAGPIAGSTSGVAASREEAARRG
jgi:hypothetical protein